MRITLSRISHARYAHIAQLFRDYLCALFGSYLSAGKRFGLLLVESVAERSVIDKRRILHGPVLQRVHYGRKFLVQTAQPGRKFITARTHSFAYGSKFFLHRRRRGAELLQHCVFALRYLLSLRRLGVDIRAVIADLVYEFRKRACAVSVRGKFVQRLRRAFAADRRVHHQFAHHGGIARYARLVQIYPHIAHAVRKLIVRLFIVVVHTQPVLPLRLHGYVEKYAHHSRSDQ